MKKTINRIAWVFAAFILAIVVCFQSMPFRAFAEDTSNVYTTVMDDLTKDESFNVADYPSKANDYSLQVITIAECENTQLFVYVYQPSAATIELAASSINISRTINNKLSFINYKLRLVNTYNVFQKYVVEDFIVNSDDVRYYNISSIFRLWNSTYDKNLSPTNENTINEVSFEVAKIFTFEDTNGVTNVSVKDVETIKITDKYVGFVRYESLFNGIMGVTDYYDSHYVAFSTDKKIDKLYQADVYYNYQEYHYYKLGGVVTTNKLTEPEARYAYLTDTQMGNYSQDNLFWKTEFEWYRISTVEDFIKTENRDNVYKCGVLNFHEQTKITEEGLQDLEGKQWVLRFTETNYNRVLTTDAVKFDYAIISNVSILRLLFETDGVVYNLGVVDNKQTGSFDSDNDHGFESEVPKQNWWRIIAIVLTVLLFFALQPIITPIVSIVVSVVALPFKILKRIFKRRKK